MLIVLAISGGNLFLNETVDRKNDPSYAFIRPSISLKRKLAFPAFEGHKFITVVEAMKHFQFCDGPSFFEFFNS